MKKLIVLLAAMLTFASTAFAQLGSVGSDLVFTPVTPCRILDTRPSQGGPGSIPAWATYSYYAGGLTTFASQGGAATNCGITAGLSVAAVAINFTVVTPTTGGYITAFPYLGTKPTAATVNFAAGAVVGNSAVVKVSQSTYTAFSIYTTSLTDVVADVVGYYSAPVSAGSLQCTDVAGTATAVPANTYSYIPGVAACAAGYSSVGVSFSAGANVVMADHGSNYLYVYNIGGTSQSVTPYTRCCRIPGR